MTDDVQRELAEVLATHRLTTPRQCFCGEREPYDERDAGFHRPEWHVAHVLTKLLPLIADAEKRAAAKALRDAAAVLMAYSGRCAQPDARQITLFYGHQFRNQAAALDPSGAAEGTGR